jgi:hypothetical protein
MEEVFMPAVPFLLACVENEDEDPIVRHEVIICLGENLEDPSIISHFLKFPNLLVSESCQAAL